MVVDRVVRAQESGRVSVAEERRTARRSAPAFITTSGGGFRLRDPLVGSRSRGGERERDAGQSAMIPDKVFDRLSVAGRPGLSLYHRSCSDVPLRRWCACVWARGEGGKRHMHLFASICDHSCVLVTLQLTSCAPVLNGRSGFNGFLSPEAFLRRNQFRRLVYVCMYTHHPSRAKFPNAAN